LAGKEKILVVILGPTASGKTGASIELALKLGTEIISADSRQFYREMNIGTAKPDPEQLGQVRHHFIGQLSVTENYSAAQFESEALEALSGIFNKHDHAVMVGGSGLYINAVCHGIDELPDPDPELRQQLKDDLAAYGITYLQDRLKVLDPEFYKIVDLSNPKRLLRALEVSLMTGTPYSTFRKNTSKDREFRIMKIGVDLPRDILNERINLRVDQMVAKGLVEEVRSLAAFRDLNALNTVGYKEIFEYLDGKCRLEESIEKIKTNTRRYAKRQMTWFRKDKDILWLEKWEDINLRLKAL